MPHLVSISLVPQLGLLKLLLLVQLLLELLLVLNLFIHDILVLVLLILVPHQLHLLLERLLLVIFLQRLLVALNAFLHVIMELLQLLVCQLIEIELKLLIGGLLIRLVLFHYRQNALQLLVFK